MFSVDGKVVFVTGGTAGIGLAAARRLLRAGASAVITGRRANGTDIAAEIGATFIQVDVTDEASLVAAFDATVEKLGPIDVVLNNAGIENTGPTIEEADAAELQRIFDVNVKAAYSVLHHAPSRMNDGGSIINTSSAAGLIGLPGYSQYSLTKAALLSLTRSAAIELAPRRIRVNAICPGSVWSEMLPPGHPEAATIEVLAPLERVGEPEEVAALVHFLASDDAKYITGAAIPIDGGVLAGFGIPLLGKIFA